MVNQSELSTLPTSTLEHLATNVVRSRRLMQSVGQTAYSGERDYYEVLGYRRDPDVAVYMDRYLRQPPANRIVNLPATDTWRNPPEIEDGESKTRFTHAWNSFIDARHVYSYLMRADILSGIGRYGILVLGIRDDKTTNVPATANSLTSWKDIVYLRALSEQSVEIKTLDKDTSSRRYGLPLMYSVKFDESTSDVEVHWTRVIHLAENKLDSEVYGTPRLQTSLNVLDDLMKFVGGSAEATWLQMRPGFLLSARDGYQIPEDKQDKAKERIEEYRHGLIRFLVMNGMEAQNLSGEVIDVSGPFENTIALLATSANMPQRVLIGSSGGKLASAEEDTKQWYDQIRSRQNNYAEPEILRPFIQRLLWLGALPRPTTGKYEVVWSSLFELDDVQKAELIDLKASAVQKLTDVTGIQPIDFDEKRELLGYEVEQEEVNPKTILKPLSTNHSQGALVDIRCAICGNAGQVYQFEDHKGLCRCEFCNNTFDPSVEKYHGQD